LSQITRFYGISAETIDESAPMQIPKNLKKNQTPNFQLPDLKKNSKSFKKHQDK
jgi:hypothetical protein